MGLGTLNSGTRGLGDGGRCGVATQGRGNSGMWDARTSKLGDARGLEEVGGRDLRT